MRELREGLERRQQRRARIGLCVWNWLVLLTSPVWGCVALPFLLATSNFFSMNPYDRQKCRDVRYGRRGVFE